MNALSNEDSEFREMGRRIFSDNWTNRARRAARFLPYWVALLLKPIARNDEIVKFFVTTLRETMEYRKKNQVRRDDFVDLLMDMKDHPEKMGDEGTQKVHHF